MSEKLKVLQPFEPRKLSYSIRELDELDKQGKLDFNIPIQRGLKWMDVKGKNDKSLLIFSILLNEPIGLMHCNCTFTNADDKVYRFLDGKQRFNAIFAFIHNEGKSMLKYLPFYQDPFTKEIIDLNGKLFKDLPENLQEKITSFKPEIYYYENASDAQQAYIFKSINNGTPLTNAEKARVELKDQDTVVALASGSLLADTIKGKASINRDDETIIKNMWAIFNMNEPNFLAKFLNPAIQDVVFSQDTTNKIKAVLDRLNSCNEIFKKQISKEKDKKLKARKKRIVSKIFGKKTHIPTLSNVVLQSIQDGISNQQFSEWLWHFFNTDKGSSLSEKYNEATGNGSSSVTAVKVRLDEAMKDYEQFIKSSYKATQDTADAKEVETKDTTKQENEPEPEQQTFINVPKRKK